MVTDKKNTLRALIESSKGVHLTIYLENKGDLINLKKHFRTSLDEAREHLKNAMQGEELAKFLSPVESLLDDTRILKDMKDNVGLFRTTDSFRIVNIPVSVTTGSHVATTFHVKPLLNWIQNDADFLLLGFENNEVHLYKGDQESLKKIETIIFPEIVKEGNRHEGSLRGKVLKEFKEKQRETFTWINGWIDEMTKQSSPKLYIAGKFDIVEKAKYFIKYKNLVGEPVSYSFNKYRVFGICSIIRRKLKKEIKEFIQRALLEFKIAEDSNIVQMDIYKIGREVSRGRVKKMVIANDVNIFGKFNKNTGALSIHPFDLDYEDDDLLDDLAQEVLVQGGEVIVAPKEQIPNKRSILAILDHEGVPLETRLTNPLVYIKKEEAIHEKIQTTP